jgi:hypothetical protein
MPSITSWTRLEPRSRNAEMNTSLQARVYDPLWLLARQWQLGEFQGEDNGSPILARWRGEAAPLSRFHSGAIAPETRVDAPPYDDSLPLETMVERETVLAGNQASKPENLRSRAEAGQHFLRMLARVTEQGLVSRDYRDAFLRRYPFAALTAEQRASLDRESLDFFDLMASRVPDGRLLQADLAPSGAGVVVLDPSLQIVPGDVAEVKETARLWRQWRLSLFSEPAGTHASWLSDRMEYAFSVGARLDDGERVLTAPEYSDGHLDWYAFDLNPEVTIGAATDTASTGIERTAIPAPISFRGMPAARFWEFEDAQVAFGAVDAGPTDLLRMLLVEFALAYGNDWFVIPVELDIGSIYQTRSLVITDTFGVRTLIRPASELAAPFSTWRMFQHSHLRGSGLTKPASNLFFLPPSLLKCLESRPMEEVLFLRDEMANLAWGVERVIESAAGQPLNRFESDQEQEQRRKDALPSPPLSSADALRYRLATETPSYWVPLLPVLTKEGLRLRRGAVLRTNGQMQAVHALGRVLESGQELSLFEEEVPREGIRVKRSYQFTRWIDGSSHVWIGRRKGVGRGEGSSGLRFDSLETKTDPL